MNSLLRRRLRAAVLALQGLAYPAIVWGQIPVAPPSEPPVAPDALSPPRLLEAVEATYPEAAATQGLEGTVLLGLSIDEQGQVTAADVLEPAGHGFDEAAREAALKFRFEPARRGGTPIAAKIRYPYVFKRPAPVAAPVEPVPVVPPPAPVAPVPLPKPEPAPVEPPPGPTVVDVNVHGQISEQDRLRQSAEAVNVVDLRRARQQTADMGEVLARTEGVVVRRDGGLGCGERFSLDGLYDEQVRMFLDGIPLELTGYSCGVSSMPVNLVEHVEIYRGVVPIRFGADALGGAVNLVSDQRYMDRAAFSYQFGSFGTHRGTLSGLYRHAPTGLVAGATVFGDIAQNDYEVDVEIPDDRGRLSPARVPRFHDRYRAVGGNVEAGIVDQTWAKRLLLRGFYGTHDQQIQNNAVMTVPYGEVQYRATTYGATGRYEVELPRDVTVEVVSAYSKRTTHFEDHSDWVYNWRGERIRERRVPGEIESDATDQYSWQHSFYGRAGVRWKMVPGHTLSIASTPQYTTRTGDELIQSDPSSRDPLTAERKRTSLVSGIEYQIDLFGDRLSNIFFVKDYHFRAKSEEPLPGGVFKKRDTTVHREGIGDSLRYRFTPWLYAKASYELATRLPGPDELFGDGVLIRANLELLPEVSHNANIGPTLELTRTGAGDFNAEVNLFYRDSDQLIVLLGNDRYFTYQNVYRTLGMGVESSADWTSPGRYVSLDSSFTWFDSRNASSDGTFGDFEGDRIPNRPYLMASWGGHLRFTGFPDNDDAIEPYYNGRWVHSFYRGWESQGLPEFKQVVDAQITHSAGVTWSLSEAFGRLTTSIEVDNLTGAKVFDNFGVERPGRAGYVKVAAEL